MLFAKKLTRCLKMDKLKAILKVVDDTVEKLCFSKDKCNCKDCILRKCCVAGDLKVKIDKIIG